MAYLRNVLDPFFLALVCSQTLVLHPRRLRRGRKTRTRSRAAEQTFYESKRRWNQAILLRLKRRSDGPRFVYAHITTHNSLQTDYIAACVPRRGEGADVCWQ